MHFPRPHSRTSVLVAGAFYALFASSCAIKPAGDARVTLKIPSSSALSSKVGAFAYSPDVACFAMNITASDIQETEDASCEIKRGVFAGTAGPNQVLTAQVLKGVGRKLELYAYIRSSSAEPCPALNGGFGSLDRRKIYLVGTVASFDVASDNVDVNVNVTLPSSTSVALASSMPTTCVAAPAPSYSSRLVAGAAEAASITSSGGFKIRQRVSFKAEEKTVESLSGNGTKLKGSLSMDSL